MPVALTTTVVIGYLLGKVEAEVGAAAVKVNTTVAIVQVIDDVLRIAVAVVNNLNGQLTIDLLRLQDDPVFGVFGAINENIVNDAADQRVIKEASEVIFTVD